MNVPCSFSLGRSSWLWPLFRCPSSWSNWGSPNSIEGKTYELACHLCFICIWFVMQAFVCQWELREVIQGRDQPHQQHIHQIRVWHRHRPGELWESMPLPHWVATELQFYILPTWVPQFQRWTLACRWSWLERCLEARALGSLSLMTLERVSPTRPFPLSQSCRSHTTLRTPTYWWSSAMT